MKLTENPAPSDELVRWACESATGVRLPADRPWFLAPPPARAARTWEYQCRCEKMPVRVQRYPCEDGLGYLYLGQCRRCETVIWAYREGHAEDE